MLFTMTKQMKEDVGSCYWSWWWWHYIMFVYRVPHKK